MTQTTNPNLSITASLKGEQLASGVMACMLKTENYVNSCGLEHNLLELIRYRVSLINGCAYCIDMHFKEALAAGETAQRMASLSIWREAPYYTDKERVVLHWAEALTNLPLASVGHEENRLVNATDALKQYFSNKQISELTLAVIQINAWNRLAKTFDFGVGSFKADQ
ncbi:MULTISPECIES: carboxymuconolactone decarboxylase family protein [unclassified Shewanella]|uniref:carboxymuconolactone decarboxylase family protein n=1 Tax=unclassified Shewanella TaxID=196818 RepID=UPI001BC6A20A|nr:MULTISPECIES: carboxymuconolactone decarboxylase family protein [unclassified Shewanella]GIU04849.1 alkyl hydroperoxide reductase AhpD [Shewanella sp. MBTL60-112-B1]GIU24707.1 alkyl hydroperoxide reductase AhpD [Shewanella sp. MBTL60-112-B2]